MPKTILIADTSENTRELLKKTLANRYSLIIVESPLQALNVIMKKHVPSLALVGIDESIDENGDSVFAAIRKHAVDITLIALGERDNEHEAVEAVKAGATGYMIKPLDPHNILSITEKNI